MNLIISINSISCYLFGQTLIFELLKLLVPTASLLFVIEILPQLQLHNIYINIQSQRKEELKSKQIPPDLLSKKQRSGFFASDSFNIPYQVCLTGTCRNGKNFRLYRFGRIFLEFGNFFRTNSEDSSYTYGRFFRIGKNTSLKQLLWL